MPGLCQHPGRVSDVEAVSVGGLDFCLLTIARCASALLALALRHETVFRCAVCTENLILFDYVTESPNVNGDDRAALLPPDPVRLAIQVEEST